MGRPGYIYVMRLWESTDPLECAYKIGQSINPAIRRTQLGIVMPYELTIVKWIRTTDMNWTERELHRAFRRQHLQGEWFYMTSDDLKFFEETDELSPSTDTDDSDLPF